MRNKIIIYSNNDTYMDAVLWDMKGCSDVVFCEYPQLKWLRLLQYYHTSLKANSYIRLPFRSVWYKSYYQEKNDDDCLYIFFFFQGVPLGYDEGYIKFLKKKYKNIRLCFNWHNIASAVNPKYVDFVINEYDIIYTFDKNDSLRYGWKLHDAIFSDISKWSLQNCTSSDVFFVGKAKGRLEIIHNIYDLFTQNGYKCDFYVVDVPKDNQTREGIVYNKYLSYIDVLSHSSSTKIILELVQEGQVGLTLRTCESIVFKKKMLTNNKGIITSDFFNNNISVFNNVSEIEPAKILELHERRDVIQEKIKYLSPIHFFKEVIKDCSNG